MNIQEALSVLLDGGKVKLPEWTGYWFREDNKTKVFTKTGDILDTPNLENYSMRTDWMVTQGLMGFDFAILSLRSGQQVTRAIWGNQQRYIRYCNLYSDSQFNISESPTAIGTWLPFLILKNSDNNLIPWTPTAEDLLATDWEIVRY
jgi:hypothetical protein